MALNLSGEKVLILGAGVTGIAVARSLSAKGGSILFADDQVETVDGFSVSKTDHISVEDINNDLSSIYLTSTQRIPINVSSKNYIGISSDQIPLYPISYKENQIILNSGRILFNSTTDSILLSSQKVISISANEDIGISTRKNVTLTGDLIKLGSINAGESLLLGDSFIKQFKVLLETMNLLCDALVAEPALKGGAPAAAAQLKTIINLIKNKNYLSRFSKTL